MISDDGIKWECAGDPDIRKTNGEPISEGPIGTPTVWVENGIWYLYYERRNEAIFLATSTDHKVWTNVQDEPVIKCGPDSYDKYTVAMDQVVKINDKYYGYYQAGNTDPWKLWTSNFAVPTDLIHRERYDKNPIVQANHSSSINIFDCKKCRLYTMHPGVYLYFSKEEFISNRWIDNHK